MKAIFPIWWIWISQEISVYSGLVTHFVPVQRHTDIVRRLVNKYRYFLWDSNSSYWKNCFHIFRKSLIRMKRYDKSQELSSKCTQDFRGQLSVSYVRYWHLCINLWFISAYYVLAMKNKKHLAQCNSPHNNLLWQDQLGSVRKSDYGLLLRNGLAICGSRVLSWW